MKNIFLILFVGFAQIAFGQSIVSPDTVCVGTNVPFSLQGGAQFTTYAWSFDGGNIQAINSPATPIPNTATSGSSLNVTAQATMVYDTVNNKYYGFATSAGGFSVQRLDFGSNPNSIPTIVDLGNPNSAFINVSYSNMEAFEVVLDANGIFHAFIKNRGIVHWVFGNGINNPPTSATRIYDNSSIIAMSMQMCVLNDGGQWRIFVGQTYGPSNIVRIDMGSDLNNIPSVLTAVSLPSIGSNPGYFAIIKENNIWYMFSTLLSNNAPLYRYNFGANLNNNMPTLVNLGNQGASLNLNRGLNFVKSCDSFYLLGLDQNGTVNEIHFSGDINNNPTNQTLGQLYGGSQMNGAQMIKPYWYGDTLWSLTSDFSSASTAVYRRALMTLPTNEYSIKYYASATNHVFNTPGVYNMILYCDQTDPRGPQTFCKQIVVVGSMNFSLGADTTLCAGDSLVLGDPNNSGNILWSTGATSPTIKIHDAGTYWVNILGSSCQTGTDTINITLNPLPFVKIDKDDTTICSGTFLKLNGSGAQTYSWEPSSLIQNLMQSNININPTATTTYYLNGKDQNGCNNQDSVTIKVKQAPNVKIITTTTEVSCSQQTIQLNASGAYSYLWSPGMYCDDSTISNPMVTPINPVTIFYVTGKDSLGCKGSDSIKILSFSEPVFFVPNAFSPNGDGLNDEFIPLIYCDFRLLSFSVFNRWGQLVYTTNKPNKGWDGTFNNKKADNGVYYWHIEGKDKFSKTIIKNGDVSLIR